MQRNTSANTSLNQIPKVWKYIEYDRIDTLLDYGCGRYDKFKEYVESQGVNYFGYDKYNRSEHENEIALACSPDIITCCNVLNVIDSLSEIEYIVARLSEYACPVIFSIYEGNKSGIGKVSKKDCFQRNQRASLYIPLIEEYFEHVVRKNNMIFCNFF